MRLLLLLLLLSTLVSSYTRYPPPPRPCKKNRDCPSRDCVVGFCVRDCTRLVLCPSGFYCDAMDCKPDSNRHIPWNLYIAPTRCRLHENCPSGECVQGWCVRKCVRLVQCPPGYWCDLLECKKDSERHMFMDFDELY